MITVDIADPFVRLLDVVDIADTWTPNDRRVTFDPFNYLWYAEQVMFGASSPRQIIELEVEPHG
jgi:hypothetical protein